MKKLLFTGMLLFILNIFPCYEIKASSVSNPSNISATTAAPRVYWEGWAANSNNTVEYYLTVYPSQDACNSYYAIVGDCRDKHGRAGGPRDKEVWVKYDSNQSRYYVTINGNNYYFSM